MKILVIPIVLYVFLASSVFGQQADPFRILPDRFRIETESQQPGHEIEKTLDGDPKTFWHSRRDAPNGYPYHVDFHFKNEETVEQIYYLPRQDKQEGRILKCEVFVWKDGEWVKHFAETLTDSRSEKTIRFPVVTTERLRFTSVEGMRGFASAAELAVFRPDNDLDRAYALFVDRVCSGLNPKLSKSEIRSEIGKLRKKSKRPEVLELLDIARSLLDNKRPVDNRTVPLARRRSVNAEKDLYKLGCPWAYFQPTGFAAEKGRPLTVLLECPPGEPTPRLFIANLRDYDWNDQEKFDLVPGRNIVVPKKNGIVYFSNPHLQRTAPVVMLPDATPIPFYRHGKTTPEQWRRQCEAPNPYGMVELASDRVLITVTAEKAKKYLTDPKKLCETFDEVMAVEARTLGFVQGAKDPHGIPQNLMHMIETQNTPMYATNHRTCYPGDTVMQVLNHHHLRASGWGPWHELGHMHQVQEYKFQGMGEVTVNIFSLEVQHHFGNNIRIDTDDMRKKIKKFMDDPERNYHANDDVFMKLAMFWQLRLAFGENFYPKLHRTNRENKVSLKNDGEKVQYFIRLASQTSGYDLTPFFLAWGIKPTPETRQYISRGAELDIPIWQNMNFSDVNPKGIVPPPKKGRR